mmetsp:Transcript_28721/g.43808  ORF Transcript_28721/g.43808 Transcript_28721/m.43808 type:complete len:202 (+) Transcript_28721:16-621(+)
MGDKIDVSAEDEAIKDDARQFMSDLVSSANAAAEQQQQHSSVATTAGADIVKAWKAYYNDNFNKIQDENSSSMMDKFWSLYNSEFTSIWTMAYDEADSNENFDETIDIVRTLLNQPGMETIQDDCFGIVHVLDDTLEMEGLWLFNGPDPEQLFGANEETSWYTFSQLGPDATDLVKAAVEKVLMPTDGKLNGKVIKNTQVF